MNAPCRDQGSNFLKVMVRQTQVLSYFPFATSSKHSSLLSQFCITNIWNQAGSRMSSGSLVRSTISAIITDERF